MRSPTSTPDAGPAPDDRTTKARIRDAAIRCIAEVGVGGATVRSVAAAAGVSPGLVIHHFGSVDGLRAACDDFVAASIRRLKQDAAAGGPRLDVVAALRDADPGHLMGYLSQVLTEDSPAVARLVDDMVADAEGYTEGFVEAGIMRPSADPRTRAAVLVIWSLGALVMHEHLRRIVGVDLTDPAVTADPAFVSYASAVYEMFAEGVMTEAFAENARNAFALMTQTGGGSSPSTGGASGGASGPASSG